MTVYEDIAHIYLLMQWQRHLGGWAMGPCNKVDTEQKKQYVDNRGKEVGALGHFTVCSCGSYQMPTRVTIEGIR